MACGPSSAEVEANWNKIRGWLTIEGPVGRPLFGGNLDAIPSPEEMPPAVSAVRDAFLEGSDWKTSPSSALPTAYRASIEHLLKWGADPQYGTCEQSGINPVSVSDRLRVAVATAERGDLARVKAAVRVALAIRQRGTHLYATVSAYALLDAIKWAKRFKVPLWPALRDGQLTADDYIRTMAIDVLCAYWMVKNPPSGLALNERPDMKDFKRYAYETLKPLQIRTPTFEGLKEVLSRQVRPTSPAIAGALHDGRAMMLNLYADLAKRHTEAVAR